jgi:5-formyltetrahydrofolate cyclo-ligase
MNERLARVSNEERDRQSAAVALRAAHVPGYERAHTVLCFDGCLPGELATRSLLDSILAEGRVLILPRVDRAMRRLLLHPIQDLAIDLESGVLGIPEPRRELPVYEPDGIDWAWVPGLAFDASGHRLGRGGGYYDRLLPLLHPGTPKWALALEEQIVTEVPVETHDERVTGVLTASRTIHAGIPRV